MRRILVILVAAAPAARGQDWQLSRVADSNTAVPGEGGSFVSSTGAPFGSPSLAGSGRVAFWAGYTQQSARDGIFSDLSGQLAVVANRTTPIPGSGQTFTGFEIDPSWDGTTVAFTGRGPAGRGVYTRQSGILSRIADTQTQVPGQGITFTTVGAPSVDGTRLTFGGLWGSPSTDGLFNTASGGTIATVVDHSTILPGATTPVTGLGPAEISGQFAAFGANNGPRVGLFLANIDTGSISASVGFDTAVPAGSGNFTSFGALSISAGNVAFVGSDDQNRRGLYASINGQLINIADTLHAGPGGIHFTDFLSVAIDGDNVAFVSKTQGIGNQLWVLRAGQFTNVLSSNTALNGITVAGILLGPEGLKGDTIAFSFYDNGIGTVPTKGGVYTATYIPAPGGVLVLGLAGLAVSRRRR